jgi:S1-C subfamily serine protease
MPMALCLYAHSDAPRAHACVPTRSPSEDGVIVTALGSEGACAASGLKVGDHITKINSIRAQDHATAIWLVDACDDKVRFSLKEATQTFYVDRARSSKRQSCDGAEGEAGEGVNRGASGGASGGVGVAGADGGATELDVGLTLVNNISEGGVGVVVVEAKAGLAADRAGLKRGHVIVSVNGVLARNHKEVVDQIDAQASRGGTAEVVVATRELSNDVDKVMGQHHAVGVPLVPCEIIVDIM